MPLAIALISTAAVAAPARVVINEFNANITSGCDLIELRVLQGGSLQGFQLWQRVAPIYTFGALTAATEELVVVHLNGASPTCNPSASGDEASSKHEYAEATYVGNLDFAWDVYSSTAGLTSTDNMLALYDSTGTILDAVLTSDDPTGTAAATSEAQAAVVAAAGQWQMVGGGVPPGGFVGDNFNSNAVQDLNATGAARTGTSIQRLNDGDTNTKSDWQDSQFATWGLLNSGQNYQLAVPASAPVAPLALIAYPTMTNGPTRIGLGAPLDRRALLIIVDAGGRRVRQLELPQGTSTVTWDGRDKGGRPVPAGLYFAELPARSTAPARIVRLR